MAHQNEVLDVIEGVAAGESCKRRAKEVRELWTLALVIVGLCFRVPASGTVLLTFEYGKGFCYPLHPSSDVVISSSTTLLDGRTSPSSPLKAMLSNNLSTCQ